jgi:DNA/RNA endonuclease G (NUC1)
MIVLDDSSYNNIKNNDFTCESTKKTASCYHRLATVYNKSRKLGIIHASNLREELRLPEWSFFMYDGVIPNNFNGE